MGGRNCASRLACDATCHPLCNRAWHCNATLEKSTWSQQREQRHDLTVCTNNILYGGAFAQQEVRLKEITMSNCSHQVHLWCASDKNVHVGMEVKMKEIWNLVSGQPMDVHCHWTVRLDDWISACVRLLWHTPNVLDVLMDSLCGWARCCVYVEVVFFVGSAYVGEWCCCEVVALRGFVTRGFSLLHFLVKRWSQQARW